MMKPIVQFVAASALTLLSSTSHSQGALIRAAEAAALRAETAALVRAEQQAVLNRTVRAAESVVIREEAKTVSSALNTGAVMQSAAQGAARVRVAEDAWNAAVQANARALENRQLQLRLNETAMTAVRRQPLPLPPPPRPAAVVQGAARATAQTDTRATLAARDELKLSLGQTTGSAKDAIGAALRSTDERLAAGSAATPRRPGLATQFDGARNPSVVYQRFDPATGEVYVGRSADTARFVNRQAAHDAKLGTSHSYRVIENANGRDAARMAEESAIRKAGGKLALANKRYEINDEKYRASGGLVPLP